MDNGFEVFDFKEEDEISESAAHKYLSKLKNPNSDDTATLKYEFLECGTLKKEDFFSSIFYLLLFLFYFSNKFF